MCDYCGCRSHHEIASLSADHEILLGLLCELEHAVDATDAPRASIVVAELHGLLDGHASREERGVFSELRRAGVDESYVGMFEADHEQIHALVASCESADWQRPSRDLIRLLSEHIGREESDLFPVAHQMLSPRQWDAIDVAVGQVPT